MVSFSTSASPAMAAARELTTRIDANPRITRLTLPGGFWFQALFKLAVAFS